jgi:zinc protease
VLPVVKRDSLLNGLQLSLLEQRSTGTVAARLRVNSGALFDLAGKGGLADLTAGMLLRGGGGLSAKNVADSVEQLGLTVTVTTGWDSTDIVFSGPADALESIFDILGRLVITPNFDQKELDFLKAQRIAALKSEPAGEVSEIKTRALATLFGTHPYGRPMRGTPESIAAITRADLQYFHTRYYAANNAELVLIGDSTVEQLTRLSRAKLGSWKKGDKISPTFRPAEPPKARSVSVLDRPGATAIVAFAEVGFSRKAADFFAATLMCDLLQRELAKVNPSIEVQAEPRVLDGPLVITLKSPPAGLSESVNAVLETMDKFASNLQSAEQVEAAKSRLIESMANKLKTNYGAAEVMLDIELFGLGRDYLINLADRVGLISPADVQRAAKAYLKPSTVTIVVAGPATECESALKSIGSVTLIK